MPRRVLLEQIRKEEFLGVVRVVDDGYDFPECFRRKSGVGMIDHILRRNAEQRRKFIRERLTIHAAFMERKRGLKPANDPGDDWCDISGGPTLGGDSHPADSSNEDGRTLLLFYSLKTGQWSGDDSPSDANGYGHASGEEDGSTAWDQDDCELWFDITQNDKDADGLTWWEEVNLYKTDPTVTNNRFAIIVADWVEGHEQCGQHILTTNRIRNNLLRDGYKDENIMYLGCDPTAGSPGGEVHPPFEGKDMDATKANLEWALTTWLPQNANSNDMFLFWVVGHGRTAEYPVGTEGGFPLGNPSIPDLTVNAAELNNWLTYMETETGVMQSVVILDICNAGHATLPTVAKSGRVVLASTGTEGKIVAITIQPNTSTPSGWTEGMLFSMPLASYLITSGITVGKAFELASNEVTAYWEHVLNVVDPENHQQPNLDDDGLSPGYTSPLPNGGDGYYANTIYI